MLAQILLKLALAPWANATPGSNYNVSSEFALAHGCGPNCQSNIAAANIEDLATFGPDFDFGFYETAANFTTSKAGDLLKLKPLDPQPLQIRSGTTIFRIQYTSKDLDGSLVPVTGFIALPYTPASHLDLHGKYPLVAFAHGTSGIYRGCAPSNGPGLYDYDSWQLLVQRGYAVIATDYAGLGNNYTSHKYISLTSQAADTYYSIMAARQALDIFTKQWVAVGHSQGGGAVWKLSESDLIKHDKHFLGSVAIAPATRVWDMFLQILQKKGSFLGYISYHAKAMQRYMPSYNLTILGEPLLQRMTISDTAQLCFSGLMGLSSDLDAEEMVSWDGIRRDECLYLEWQDKMAPAVNGTRSSHPVLVVQGLNDTSVLPEVTRTVYEMARKAGSRISLSEYPGMEHSPVIAAAAAEWLAWVDARFKNKPLKDHGAKVQHPYNLALVKAPSEGF